MTFYVYVDSTDDGRPFYVGKGDEDRLLVIERNVVHSRIARKYGRTRRIVFETLHEPWAFEREIELIALLKTRAGVPDHWGANLTRGGEGVADPSPEVRQRMSEGQRRRAANGQQTRHNNDSRQRIQAAVKSLHQEKRCGMHGRRHSPETIEKMRRAHTGRHPSDETKRKVGDATRQRFESPEFRTRHRNAVKKGMKCNA